MSIERLVSYGAAVTETEPRTFRVGRVLLGFLYALIAHALVIGAGVVFARTAPAGEGFTDLANLFTVLFLGEFAIIAISLITGIVLLVRGKRDLATGIIVGGLLGVVAFLVIRFANLT